ncbi:MAG: sigma-70 family RNA polymerase sigma factor [Clostridiales bacterium]|nr:sigma-70 family RNA polymerase sigma factor [Clostridiales bacterium]
MNLNEDAIIKKAQKGDNDSFELLIVAFQDKAYAIAFGVMGNTHDAYDMVQESFIKVYNNLNKFNFNSSFNTWLYRIIKNTCIDQLRKNNRKKTLSYDATYYNNDNELSFQIEDKKNSMDAIFEKKDSISLINSSLEKLSHDHRTVIVLSDIKGYDYQEISELLKISLGTVKSRISRGRRRLAEIIREEGTILD